MEKRWTPGPWEAWSSPTRQYPDDPIYDEWTVSAGRGANAPPHRRVVGCKDIASIGCSGDVSPAEAEANARLIAAAPMMAEALEKIARMENLPEGDAGEEMSSRLQAARIARAAL